MFKKKKKKKKGGHTKGLVTREDTMRTGKTVQSNENPDSSSKRERKSKWVSMVPPKPCLVIKKITRKILKFWEVELNII